jgi:3-oxo-5alpha-steroid 4-dehydrogenase
MSTEFSSSRPCRLHEVAGWDIETDVLVLGFGAAGACVAIEAATAGAKVVLVETAAGSGGTTALSGGEIYVGGSGGTLQQRTAGFTDDTEDLYKYLLMAGGPNADAAKVRLYADNSVAHFEWLQTQGVVYKNSFIAEKIVEPETDDCLIWSGSEEAWPFSEQARPCPRGHTPQWMGLGGGRYLMDRLTERVVALGVDVRYGTRALALIADENNRVHGLVLKIDGAIKFARARKGVVLCAGGFVMNRDMVQRHAPLFLRSNTPIGTVDDGSGILMGQSVGGSAINMHEGFVTTPWYPPSSLVKGIFVNARGQRFINEDCYHGRVSQHILQQTGDRIFLLQDNETYARGAMADLSRIDIGAVGETWEEVEQELGLPHNSLVSTVNTYNEYAAKGEDPLFHKAKKWLKPLTEGPFVALDCRIDHAFYASFTLGGLDTLPTGEVLRADGSTIPGLYAAGRTTCGLPRWGAGYSSGMSIADASFFGRQAGKCVAQAAALG